MMYIHGNNELDKRIDVSKIANNISTMGEWVSISWPWPAGVTGRQMAK